MNGKRNLITWALISMLAASAQGSEVIFQQHPVAIGNPSTEAISIGSTQSDDPDEPRAKAWDNFSLSLPAVVDKVTWMGAFNRPFNPNDAFRGDIDFQFEIFSNLPHDAPNLSDVVFSATLESGMAGIDDGPHVSSSVVDGALQRSGGVVVEYEADLSFLLSPGKYWVSIVADQTFPSPHPDEDPDNPNAYLDPVWNWVAASDGDNLLYHFDELFDSEEPGFGFNAHNCPISGCDATFSLVGQSVPEPSSWLVLGSLLSLVSVCRRRRR